MIEHLKKLDDLLVNLSNGFYSDMSSDQQGTSLSAKSSASDYGTSDRWFVLLWLALDYFVLYLHRNVINFVQPPLKDELQISDSQIGDLQMAFLLAYAFSQLFVGYLGDRFHRRTVLLISLTASIFSLAGMGLAGSFSTLIVLRIVLGVAQSASVPAIAGVMADCFTPRTRSTAVGIYLVSQNIALIVAGWVGGEIADLPPWKLSVAWLGTGPILISGWRIAMIFFSIIGTFVVLGMYLFLREPARTERETGRGLGVEGASIGNTTWNVIKVRAYLLLAIAFVLFCVITNAREMWLARYFYDVLGMKLGEAGRFATLYVQSSTIAGLFVGGVWADNWARRMKAGRMLVQAIGFALLVPAFVILGATTYTPLLIASMLAIGFGTGIYVTNLWATTFDVVDPAARSTATAFLNVASMLAAPTSRAIGYGLDNKWFGLGQIFSGLGLVALVTVAVLVLNVIVFVPRDYRGPLK